MEEPYVPFFRGKLPHLILSSSLVLLCIVLALSIMVSIIAYRVSVQVAIDSYDENSVLLQKFGPIFTSLTAALINLICILIFNMFYMRLAFYLTERELPRTQTEFDNSLTLKMYLFQFVNYYSSIFYIAFFKGKFIGHPGESNNSKIELVEECPTGL
jgi:anoctamin-1